MILMNYLDRVTCLYLIECLIKLKIKTGWCYKIDFKNKWKINKWTTQIYQKFTVNFKKQ